MTKPLAVQLYTLRNLGDVESILKAAHDAGYRAVETVGDQGLKVEELKGLLEKYELKAVSSHVSMQRFRENFAETVAFFKDLGNNTLVVPHLQDPQSAEGWQALGRELGDYGQRLKDEGMRLLYHNHDFEMKDYGGERAIHLLLEAADPDHLGFEPDLAWVVRGGADPFEILSHYSGRCPCLHVKDLAPEGTTEQGGFADVGHGTMPWDELLGSAQGAGVEWFVVEHDMPDNPADSIKRSFNYLDKKLK